MPMANIMSAMMTNSSSLSPIELAARTQNRVFVLYIVVLVIGGLLTAGLTVWLWRVTNRYQDAVQGDADARIAEANAKASQANAEAAKANEGLARSNEKIAAADQHAGEANKRAKELAVKAEELKEQNLATAVELEKERKTRLELEQSLTPRQIALVASKAGKLNIDPLKPFAGIQMFVEILPDAEAERAAGNIIWLTKKAGWNLSSAMFNPELKGPFFDGVIVMPYMAPRRRLSKPPFWTEEEYAAEEFSREAAEELVNFLKSNNWSAHIGMIFPKRDGEIPLRSVKITVGFKPSPYFRPQWVKELEDNSKKIDKEIEDVMRQLRQLPPKTPPKHE